MNANERAFLAMIAFAEGTDREPDPYRVCYAYRHRIASLQEHPAVSGEWRGERLPDYMCRAAGFGPGCVSTAAGRYQLIRPTWVSARDALQLRDFSPDSQDAAALWLCARQGATSLIRAGRVHDAIKLVRRVWASLPGAGWKQPERAMETLLVAYKRAGGILETVG